MTDKQDVILRKKICLTQYHNNLLNDITDKRYANRSEAVRASIQHHERYITEDGETDIEALRVEIEQISDNVELINEKLDEREPNVIHIDQNGTSETEGEDRRESDAEIKESIVTVLNVEGPLSMDEIAERTGERMISIIPLINSLESDGVIQSINDNEYTLNNN